MGSKGLTPKQVEHRAAHVLRRGGMSAGKAYAAKHGYTLPANILRTAAQRWSRWKERGKLRKDLGKYGYKLYRMRVTAAQEEGS